MAQQNNGVNIAQGDNMAVANPYENLNISKYVVAAMCGCWWRESNCNPKVWESLIPCAWDYQYEYLSKGGYGLGQWTNVGTQHGRLWNLHQWCINNGYADGDGYGQLIYVYVENVWNTDNPSRLGYNTLIDFLQSTSTSTDDLVYDFLSRWEGVPNDHYSERCGYATTILNYINAHMNDGTNWSWIDGNNYLTTDQICNNAMVIYNYMVHGGQSGAYRINVTVSGNGVAYVNPTSVDLNDTYDLTVTPASGESLIDIIATAIATGEAIAVSVITGTQTITQSVASDVSIIVSFTGTPPTPPTPIYKRKGMPIWMYPILRC